MANAKTADLSTAALELLVELLAARDRANGVRDQVGSWIRSYADPLGVWSSLLDGAHADDLRNLAYGVATIQVRALTELTKQSEEYSRKIVQRLQAAKRPPPARAASETDRLQVCTLRSEGAGDQLAYRGDFIAPARIAQLPHALVLRALESAAEFPVAAKFEPATDVPEGTRIAVTVPHDPWIEPGKRYKALVALSGCDRVVWFKLLGNG